MSLLRKSPLPDGKYFGLTWSIPDNFGGLTSVLFHRSKTFIEYGKKKVDILTLSPEVDLAVTTRMLHDSGQLDSRVRLRNLWEELRTASDRDLARLAAHGRPSKNVQDDPPPFAGDLASTRRDAEGNVLQVDRFRQDGTRLVCDRRDAKRKGVLGGRIITLYSRRGRPLGEWSSATQFYFSWLDHVIGGHEAFLINDSQFIGGFLHGYRRDNVTVTQVIHGDHLDNAASDPFGPLSPGKIRIVKALDGFDLVATLTQRQADYLRSAYLATDNMRVVPNSRDTVSPASTGNRDPNAGVMVARLGYQKRVEDAIQAVALARRNGSRATLHVYGDGGERPKIEKLIRDLDGSPFVRLKGYEPNAARRFSEASFSILSSRSEGMGLVLVESMAAGCIPIAYDIRYGPADIITSGVDGFLVPAGDVVELARVIDHVATLDDESLQRMRDAAMQRAQDFGDARVVRRWGEVLSAAKRGKLPIREITLRAVARKVSQYPTMLEIQGTLTSSSDCDDIKALLSWSDRSGSMFGRNALNVERLTKRAYTFTGDLPFERFELVHDDVIDLYIDVVVDGQFKRLRLVADNVALPDPFQQYKMYVTKYGNISISVSG